MKWILNPTPDPPSLVPMSLWELVQRERRLDQYERRLAGYYDKSMKWNNHSEWRAREPWDTSLYGVACAIITHTIEDHDNWSCEVKDVTYSNGKGKSFILSRDGQKGIVDVFLEDMELLACHPGPDRWAKCAALMVPLCAEAHNLIICQSVLDI